MNTRILFALLAVAALTDLALAILFGTPPMLMAAAPATLNSGRAAVLWNRKREPMKPFTNVVANAVAQSVIPAFRDRTILGLFLDRTGSTTFTDAQLTRLEIFFGTTSIFGPVSGANLRMTERYIHGAKESGYVPSDDPYWLPIDFTIPNSKEYRGEMLGGVDQELLGVTQDNPLRVEAEIAGATAPALRGEIVWGPPQRGLFADFAGLMRKLITRQYPTQAAGDWNPDIDLRDAIMLRQYFRYTVTNNAVATAGTAANNGTANTGNGTVTATVTALTPAGRYKAICIEPGANVGTFAVFTPRGQLDGLVVTGAGATTLPSGLVVSATDGGTDFAAGDTFFLDVLPENTQGNINLIELAKNEDKWWFARCSAARMMARRYGHNAMAGLYCLDPMVDNHTDGVIDTKNAITLDYRVNFTAQDTPSIVHEVLAEPLYSGLAGR